MITDSANAAAEGAPEGDPRWSRVLYSKESENEVYGAKNTHKKSWYFQIPTENPGTQ